MNKKFVKLASSGTFEGIQKLIKEFYCGEEKEIKKEGDIYCLYTQKGNRLSSYIKFERKRFVFGFDMD